MSGSGDGEATESSGGVEHPDTKAVKPELLDFLFTFALTLGLAPEFIGEEFSGLLSVDWVTHINSLPSLDPIFVFDLLVFFLGIFTLTFSWYGFNSSVSENPVLYGSLVGLLRFFLDAFLVVLYGFVLIQFQHFEIVVATLILIYFLYAVWDLLKLIEYHRDPWARRETEAENAGGGMGTTRKGWALLRQLARRRSLLYFVAFLVVGAIYFFVPSDGLIVDYAALLALIVLSVLYRYQKAEGRWRPELEIVEEFEGAYD